MKEIFEKFKKIQAESHLEEATNSNNLEGILPLYCLEREDIVSERDVFAEGFQTKRIVLSHKAIDKLNPDKVEINKFWEMATHYYPYLSISGYAQAFNKEESNDATLSAIHEGLGGLALTKRLWEHKNQKLSVLEIGPGYGGYYNWLKGMSGIEYYGIDVNPLFKCDTLYKCDGRNFPDPIPLGLDLVYSFNVFQHLSRNQRNSYYQQAYAALEQNGILAFSNYCLTPNNEAGPFWRLLDENGRYYAAFFNQFVEVDTLKEVYDDLERVGFDVFQLTEEQTTISIAAIKK